MYIDIDSRGFFSIHDLCEADIRFFKDTFNAYVRCRLGLISSEDSTRIYKFEKEFNHILNNYETREKQEVDNRRR